MTRDTIAARAFDAFRRDAQPPPPLTLRGAYAVDGYDRGEPFDPSQDEPTDAYLETFAFWGLAYLDAQSWRHYLPRLIDYTLRRPDDPAMVVEALVRSLRPPDRYPPRLASLSADQESVVTALLQHVARHGDHGELAEEAQQALAEWWGPSPRSRPTEAELAAARAAPASWRTVERDGFRLELPETLVSGGGRDIPGESRRVEVWGGLLGADAHTVVAVNTSPLAVRSLQEAIDLRSPLFRAAVTPRGVEVPLAREAHRLDGLTHGDSPAEPQAMTLVFAVGGSDLYLLSIRAWPRDDVARIVESIVASFALTSTGVSAT
jgi:hypothetical protein